MLPASPGASCFGKLPTRGDFVRLNASSRAMRELDTWIQRGIMDARSQLGSGLVGAFEAAGTVSFFVEVPNTPHALAGALRASRDRTGRRYPFLVAVEVEKRNLVGRRIPSWPTRYEAFFRDAAALVDDAIAGRVGAEALPDALGRLRAIYDATPFPVDYEFRLRQSAVPDLWKRTWGSAGDQRKYILLRNLTSAVVSRGGRSVRLPAALRLSLPSPPRGLDVSFWLESIWSLADGTPDAPAFFWSDDDEAMLLIASAPLRPGVVATLLAGRTHSGGRDVVALDDPNSQSAVRAALALPPRYGTLLEEEGLSLHAFIHRLAR